MSFVHKQMFRPVDQQVFAKHSTDHVSALQHLSKIFNNPISLVEIIKRTEEASKSGQSPSKLVYKVKLQRERPAGPCHKHNASDQSVVK